jgi:hypothetical protein
MGIGMLIASLCAALLVAIRYPETPTGQFIRRWLIEKPAAFLDGLTFRKVLGWAVFLIAIYAMAQALPMELALMGALDASATAEFIVAAGLLAANLRFRTALRLARAIVKTCVRSAQSQIQTIGRCRRTAGRALARLRPRLKPPSADDDGGAAGLAFA